MKRGWERGWEYLSLDTLTTLEVSVDSPSPPYPAMITVELDGASLLAEDVREMARIFHLAADVADRLNVAAFEEARRSAAEEPA